MLGLFIKECIGALVQLLLFSFVPFILWLLVAKRKQSFFAWIGIKTVKYDGKWWITVCAILIVTGLYIGLTIWMVRCLPKGVTTAGSNFAGKGGAAFPAVLAYGYIRTGLSEEIVFRGFLLKCLGEKIGYITGNTIQAIIFGMMHGIPFGVVTHNILVAIVLTMLPGILGWFLGWMNEKRCDGSIIPSWLLHGTINVVVATLSL